MSVDKIALRRCTEEDAQTLALVSAATFLDAFAGVIPGPSIVEHCKGITQPTATASTSKNIVQNMAR